MKYFYAIIPVALLLLMGCFEDDTIRLDDKEPRILDAIRFRRLANLPVTYGNGEYCDNPARHYQNVRRLAGTDRYINRTGWLPENFPVAEAGVQFTGSDAGALGDLNNLNLTRNFRAGTTTATAHPWIRVVRDSNVYRSILFDESTFTVVKQDENAEFIVRFAEEFERVCPSNGRPLMNTYLNYTGFLYNVNGSQDSILLDGLAVRFNNEAI